MITRMKALISLLNEADEAYFKYDRPIISDMEYDNLCTELTNLENESGIILSGSPLHRVPGVTLEQLQQVEHSVPMLSAQKTKSKDGIMKFIGHQAVLKSWKLDGLTLVLYYEDGCLRRALTRGEEGRIGEDVTHCVRMMENVPFETPNKQSFVVRGEGILSWMNFEKINSTLEDPYTHPRNLAAGSIRRLDAEKSRNYHLEFFAFDLIEEPRSRALKSEKLEFLKENGFEVVGYTMIPETYSREQISETINSDSPEAFPYPVDGLIFEYDNLAFGEMKGATGHHRNNMIALKWEDTLYDSKFLGLEIATTRTGMISLTGKFIDTVIDGTKVNRAYLHNLNIMEKFNLGIGDQVKLYKANKIIPQLAENITRSGTLELPQNCPCCDSELIIKQMPSGSRYLYCIAESCPAKLINKFVHFSTKSRMNIVGLSEKTLEKFIKKGWLQNFGDIYELERHKEEIVQSEGFGEASFLRLQEAIHKSRQCELYRFIAAVGIPMVGRSAGRVLDKYFEGSFEKFEEAIKSNFDFSVLEDFGEIKSNNIHAWYQDDREKRLWKPLLQHIAFKEKKEEHVMKNNVFFGKKVVATGKLTNYTRDEIKERLMSLGAKPGSSVSRKTDFLIVGEKPGSKVEEAGNYGIRIIDEEEFERLASA